MNVVGNKLIREYVLTRKSMFIESLRITVNMAQIEGMKQVGYNQDGMCCRHLSQ